MKKYHFVLVLVFIFIGCSTFGYFSEKRIDELKMIEAENYHPREIGDVTPVNPNATPEAEAVLTYLSEISKGNIEGFIIGQNCGHGYEIADPAHHMGYRRLVENLHTQTGKYVGMVGVDYGFGDSYSAEQLARANRVLIDFWNDGGLVQVTWCATNPLKRLTGPETDTDLRLLLDETTVYYQAWYAYLDEIAAALEELQDNGVVVLWRPLQEMNGSWVWYGIHSNNTDPELYKALWIDMFEYFTYEKGLNNLLWVYAPASFYDNQLYAVQPVLSTYPGDDYVDIVAGTHYTTDYSFMAYQAYRSTGKPLGASEFGHYHTRGNSVRGIRDMMLLSEHANNDSPAVSYVMFWHSWQEKGLNNNMAIVDNSNTKEFMNHPLTITRDKISWRDYLEVK